MKPSTPIEFKGTVASLSALALALRSDDIDTVIAALEAKCRAAPDFFAEDIVLIDADELPDHGAQTDWAAVVAILRRFRLNPVAVRNAASIAEKPIRAAGMTLAEQVETCTRKQAAKSPAAPQLPPPNRTALIVERPVRSGQQIYARDTDLIVLSMVNPGAEIMADGHIHVYAPLRGRALAGASGNTAARILTTCFEAELVAVGGVYRALEPGMPRGVRGKSAQTRMTVDSTSGKQTLLIEEIKVN